MNNETEYLLHKLQEECAEVIHAAAKMMEHGRYATYPGSEETNEECVVKEMCDVMAVLAELYSRDILTIEPMTDRINEKRHVISIAMKKHLEQT